MIVTKCEDKARILAEMTTIKKHIEEVLNMVPFNVELIFGETVDLSKSIDSISGGRGVFQR